MSPKLSKYVAKSVLAISLLPATADDGHWGQIGVLELLLQRLLRKWMDLPLYIHSTLSKFISDSINNAIFKLLQRMAMISSDFSKRDEKLGAISGDEIFD